MRRQRRLRRFHDCWRRSERWRAGRPVKKATVMAHHCPHVAQLREQLVVASPLDGLLLTRAVELRELGHELVALAFLGGLVEGFEAAGRVGSSQRQHLGSRCDAVLDALAHGVHAGANGVGRPEHTGDLRLRALGRRLASLGRRLARLAHLLDRLERLLARLLDRRDELCQAGVVSRDLRLDAGGCLRDVRREAGVARGDVRREVSVARVDMLHEGAKLRVDSTKLRVEAARSAHLADEGALETTFEASTVRRLEHLLLRV